jgi:hypothetical protein
VRRCHQAELAKAKAERMKGEVVPVADVQREWTGRLRALRARILAVGDKLRHLPAKDHASVMTELRLRKAACRRLAEAGCSDSVIAVVSGHRDPREVACYRRAAEQRGLARHGMGAVADAFGGEKNTAETFSGDPVGNLDGKRA